MLPILNLLPLHFGSYKHRRERQGLTERFAEGSKIRARQVVGNGPDLSAYVGQQLQCGYEVLNM